MTEKENKSPTYIHYPYDLFLKLRVEFLILTQSDLKARIMRLIERCVENERDAYYRAECNKPCNKGKTIEVPDGIFAEISHRFFMDEMWGIVQSETTLRDALREMENDHLIIRRPGGNGPYDAPFYTLNKPLIDYLFTLLPPLEEIDMVSLMKQPRKKKQEDGTVERGTIIDPLARMIRGAIIAPPDPQLLDPYPSIIAPLSSTRGVQKLYPKRYKENLEENKENTNVSDDTTSPFGSLSPEEIELILAHRNKQKSQTPSEEPANKKPANEKPARKPVRVEKPAPAKQSELPHVDEPDLSHLSDVERDVYSRLRPQDRPKFLAWTPRQRAPYMNYLGTMGYGYILNITPAVENAAVRLEPVQPTIQDFNSITQYVKAMEKAKPANLRQYTIRGLKFWDYPNEIIGWKSSQEMNKPDTPSHPEQGYSIGGYTYKPEEAPTEELPFAGPFRNQRNKRRGA